MTIKPGITFTKPADIHPETWIINPYNHLDNFQVASVAPNELGRFNRIKVTGKYLGSDIEHVRYYEIDDELMTSAVNPRVSFLAFNKTSDEIAFDLKMDASNDDHEPAWATFNGSRGGLYLFNPAKNAAAIVNDVAGSMTNSTYAVNYTNTRRDKNLSEDIREEWHISECRMMHDKESNSSLLPFTAYRIQLRNCTSLDFNTPFFKESIDRIVMAQSAAIALGLKIDQSKLSENVIQLFAKDKGDYSVIVSIDHNGKLGGYSHDKIYSQAIVNAISEPGNYLPDNFFLPNSDFSGAIDKLGLEITDGNTMSYRSRSLGYHYNENNYSDDLISDQAKYLLEKLKSFFGDTKIKVEFSREYGHIDFDLNSAIESDPKKMVCETPFGIFIRSVSDVKRACKNTAPDFSVAPPKAKFNQVSFPVDEDGGARKLVDLNLLCQKAIEHKLDHIHKDHTNAFTKAEMIQGDHLDNYGIAMMIQAKRSIDALITQAKKAGVIYENLNDPGFSM